MIGTVENPPLESAIGEPASPEPKTKSKVRGSILRSNSMQKERKIASVNFSENPPEVLQELTIDAAEIKQRWYTNGEYFWIKKEALNSVRRMSTTRVHESDNFTARGLEIIDDTQVRRRKETIDTTVQRVLEAQEKRGSSPEMLSPLYKQITQPCVKESLKSAKQNAKEAKAYMEGPSRKASDNPPSSTLGSLCSCLRFRRS